MATVEYNGSFRYNTVTGVLGNMSILQREDISTKIKFFYNIL